jgi:VanZ family protein
MTAEGYVGADVHLAAPQTWRRCRRAYHSAMSTQVAATRRSALSLWLPVVVWAGVIFAFSAVPSLGTGLGTWDLILRKLAHVTEYAVLGFLLARALRRPAVAVLLAAGYAATDEVHQTFVEGRHGAPRDVAIDAVGALVGALLWLRWSRRG